ncbi:phosphotransferase [Saccharothrix syringae]|uniref:phosphotransferase n=1 Tax=Saccharothrix syringae TaxID=103733 RepID=UPI000527CDF3|nr:phosphotransferase [Saccharothrix syringae]
MRHPGARRRVRFFAGGTGPAGGEVACHGDFGPWNVVWRDGRPVGVLGWDYAECVGGRPTPSLPTGGGAWSCSPAPTA